MRKVFMAALVLMIVAQLYVPISMMNNRYDILNTGQEYKFKVKPVDPYDAFHGRYVAIRVENENRITGPADKKKGYVVLNTDASGYSHIEKVTDTVPDGQNYIKVKLGYNGNPDLPFDRYYMEEKLAPEAERIYNSGNKDAYIKVRVKNGVGVIEGLYIEDMRIEEYVKKAAK